MNEASIGSVTNNIFRNIGTGFTAIRNHISGYFLPNNNQNNNIAKNDIKENITNTISETENNGIAIAPSTDSIETDENTKIKLKNSFSDEVTVNPDQSGTAGVITPVFKKTNGDDFLYVLVPVKEKKQ